MVRKLTKLETEPMTFMFWIAIFTLLLYTLAAFDLIIGNRMVRALREVSPFPGENPLRVSVIVPACNR
jgi:hypothetical protein